MKLNLIFKNARSAVFEIIDDGIYYTSETYKVRVNNVIVYETNKVTNTIYNLKPDTTYKISVGDELLEFNTDYEYVTLDIKEFGAYGDGENDDTIYIQAAIMACPENSRVLIPKGDYKVTNLFLKSNINIELALGARIIADNERLSHPIFPGMIESYDEKSEYNLGSWEGNPLSMFAGIITGIDVENVTFYGEGIIFGNASHDDWWHNEKVKNVAWRPRLTFLKNCNNVKFIGVLFKNSPSWTIHPYFSQNLDFLDIKIENPMISPNTDGIDIESCKNVNVIGCRFTLGDDCIAVKSGKIYMAQKYKTPSENILISQCLMENGHGAVTIGSEMATGVYNLVVEKCRFVKTDRGLRIKTRRGRGKLAVVADVIFRDIIMDGVMTPFVANCFYFCDPDGKSDYVQNKGFLPLDDRTPHIKRLVFEQIKCYNAHVAAGYFYGLPEQKISEIIMRNIDISFANEAKSDVAAMHCDAEVLSKSGIFAHNVEKLVLENVNIEGYVGELFNVSNVDEVIKS